MNPPPDERDPAGIEPDASEPPRTGEPSGPSTDRSPVTGAGNAPAGVEGELTPPGALTDLTPPASSGDITPPTRPGDSATPAPGWPGWPPSERREATVAASDGGGQAPASLLGPGSAPPGETPAAGARTGEIPGWSGGVPPGPSGDGAPQAPAARLTRRERFRAWRFAPVVEVIATIALALVLAESVQAAVVKPFVIPSQSMEPTLLPGQRVLVNRLAYDFGGLPQRGDIVVFHPPSSLTCAVNVPITEPCPRGVGSHASDFFVKRVIGLPGDRLSIENGHPVINGKELTNEPYITPCTDSTSCEMPHTIVIPRGEYYMLGDNRGDSDDSRYWGPVPLSWIIGEVFATYWPIDRIGFF
ncbi:MAG: signal peptidase I [Solirubrobacteraceae bacterium]